MNKNQKGFAHIFLLVLITIIGIGAIGYFAYKNGQIRSDTQIKTKTVYSTKEECEEKTGKLCAFQMCDLIPPGKTFEETCGKGFTKGWVDIEKDIPENKDVKETNGDILIAEEIKETNGTANWQTYDGQGYLIKYPRSDFFESKIRKDGSEELTFFNLISDERKEGIQIIVSGEATDLKSVDEMESAFSEFVKIGNNISLATYPDTDPPDFCITYNLINSGKLFTLHIINPNSPHGRNCDKLFIKQVLSTFKFAK